MPKENKMNFRLNATLIALAILCLGLTACSQDNNDHSSGLFTPDLSEPGTFQQLDNLPPCPTCAPDKSFSSANSGTIDLKFKKGSGTYKWYGGNPDITISVIDEDDGHCAIDQNPDCVDLECMLKLQITIVNDSSKMEFKYDGTTFNLPRGRHFSKIWIMKQPCGKKNAQLPLKTSSGHQLFIMNPDRTVYKFGCQDCSVVTPELPNELGEIIWH